MSQDVVIKVTNINKEYDSVEVLSEITFEVQKGEVFALLGPDGSGKTILIEILEGIRSLSNGEAIILNFNVKSKIEMRAIKKRIGVLPQEFSTHGNLTVKENLQFWGKMYDKMLEVSDLLSIFNIEEYENVRYSKLPNNIKRKVGLATAFVNDPQLIFLDEPTAGLDYYAKKEIWDIITEFKKQGKTIFLTTNLAQEPHAIADKVAIIHQGRIRDMGSPEELIDRYSSEKKFIVRCPNKEALKKAKELLETITKVEIVSDEIILSSEEITLLEMLEKLDKEHVKYSDIITSRPSLNDVFLNLTGESLIQKQEILGD
ncbi:MAG: ABC transporter ATP-binding protein [Candidatus Heimdallarchaeota archaeon]